jgi:DNA polymerase
MNDAALRAVQEGRAKCGVIEFRRDKNILFMKLPSGRTLNYLRPEIRKGTKFGNDCLTYEGMDQTTKQWVRMETFGGKLVENAVQGIARDCLMDALLAVDSLGFPIVLHVHDEIVTEVAPAEHSAETGDFLLNGQEELDIVLNIMKQSPVWAPDLPLNAEGGLYDFYQK